MRRITILFLGLLLLLTGSCASNRSSRAIRKAERMMARQEAQAEKDYEKAIHLTELGQRIDPDFREFKMNMPIL